MKLKIGQKAPKFIKEDIWGNEINLKMGRYENVKIGDVTSKLYQENSHTEICYSMW